jgi:hypothetical protein
LTHAHSRAYNCRMTIREVNAELQEGEPAPRPIDKAIAEFLVGDKRDEWTMRTGRQVLAEDAEFFQMLGDR